LDYQRPEKDRLRLVVKGNLDAESAGRLWRPVLRKVGRSHAKTLEIDAGQMESCDAAGIALLLELKSRQQAGKRTFRIDGLRSELAELMELFDPGPPAAPMRPTPAPIRLVEGAGEMMIDSVHTFHAQVSFVGELLAKSLTALVRPGRFRWGDTLLIVEKAGADGVGITSLLGFLIGLILAFQSAVAMGNFGAEIYTADLVTIVLFRELGPLITGFVLASRTSSAFAAELGTMKVNEEIDALTTMGIDPVHFLVFPRLIAGIVAMPLLTLFNIAFGLIGCALVMVLIGFTPTIVIEEIHAAADVTDLIGGMAKTFVFGALIAGIGCRRGLETGAGASAVGESTTRAVVASIVAIVVADGIFAVVYFFLGI
jgi:phospholipid/cholesterol/gamma-HCH transport system permease protein